jgi:type III restriction enzyme
MAIRPGEGPERFLPALDEYEPIGSTDGLNFNSPTDKCVPTEKSHLSHAVCDSNLERRICAILDEHSTVDAWVKNHRLFLEIPYLFFGQAHRYRPDFLISLAGGGFLLLEGKGVPDEKDDAKATAARRWVAAVNAWGGLGRWRHHICYEPATLADELLEIDKSVRT